MTPGTSSSLFQAGWPTLPKRKTSQKVAHSAWNIFSVIVFPIGLVRLARKGATQLIVKKMIFVATDTKQLSGKNFDALKSELSDYKLERTQFMTPDGAQLDGCFIEGENPDKVIIYRTGNAWRYEELSEEIKFLVESTKASVFVYNPRHIGESRGSLPTKKTIGLDCFSACEYLQHKGIDPSNFLLFGHSLGGAEVTEGALLFQKKYPDQEIPLVIRSTFYSMEEAARSELSHFKFLASLVVKIADWNVQVAKDLNLVQGRKCIIYGIDERVEGEKNLDEAFPNNTSVTTIELKFKERLTKEESDTLTPGRIAWEAHIFQMKEWEVEEKTKMISFIRSSLDLEDVEDLEEEM